MLHGYMRKFSENLSSWENFTKIVNELRLKFQRPLEDEENFFLCWKIMIKSTQEGEEKGVPGRIDTRIQSQMTEFGRALILWR